MEEENNLDLHNESFEYDIQMQDLDIIINNGSECDSYHSCSHLHTEPSQDINMNNRLGIQLGELGDNI